MYVLLLQLILFWKEVFYYKDEKYFGESDSRCYTTASK